MAFLFYDDFMSLSGGVSFGLLGDATKSHQWRIWSWRIGCYQGLISRMFVVVSMKENEAWRKGACDMSTWKSREMNESALANFALEELAQMAKFKVGPSWACVDDETRVSAIFHCFFMFQHVSASQKMSSVKTHRKRRKPRLIVAATVGVVVWVDDDFATASCFWGDAHANEVVQKNCMKFWDGRTVWQSDHVILETPVVGPLEGEGHIPRV